MGERRCWCQNPSLQMLLLWVSANASRFSTQPQCHVSLGINMKWITSETFCSLPTQLDSLLVDYARDLGSGHLHLYGLCQACNWHAPQLLLVLWVTHSLIHSLSSSHPSLHSCCSSIGRKASNVIKTVYTHDCVSPRLLRPVAVCLYCTCMLPALQLCFVCSAGASEACMGTDHSQVPRFDTGSGQSQLARCVRGRASICCPQSSEVPRRTADPRLLPKLCQGQQSY